MSPKTRHNDRKCVGTGIALPPEAVAIRFAAAPDGTLTPDYAGKLPGRGAWVSADRDALLMAVRRKGFARALKSTPTLPDGLDDAGFADRIAQDLRSRLLSTLGMARKVGQLVTGFEIVKREAPSLLAYITPQDAAADGVQKIKRVLAATTSAPHIELDIDGSTLGSSVGEPGAVHLGIAKGNVGLSARYDLLRWARFTGQLQEEPSNPKI